ncbi:MAG: ABC transporter substrate-binding protein [Candidatus Eremiobacterota bacterium]
MKRWVWLLLLATLSGCARAQPERGWLYSAGDWAVPPAYHGNPWAPGGVGVAASYVYEPLFFFVPEGNRFLPRLGERFEEGPDRITVHLKRGVRWHDGHPFTSRDVECTFLLGRLKNLEVWEYLDRLDCPDEHTVVFRFRRRSPVNRLRALTEPITSAQHLFGRFAERGEELTRARQVLFREHPELPVGTGPFRLTRVTPSDMQLDRFEGYHGVNRLKGVRLVRWGRNEVVWSYLYSGGVDAISPACPYDLARAVLRRNPQMRLVTPSDLSEMGLLLNCRHPFLRDVRVRRALAHLLDRDQIRTIACTMGVTVQDTNLGLVQSQAPLWLSPEALARTPRTPHDPGLARQLLREAGVRLEKPLEIMAPSGFTDLALLAEVAAAQMQAAGLPARVRLVPGELYASFLQDGRFDLAASFGSQMGRWVHPSVSLSRFFYNDAPLTAGAGLPRVRQGMDTHDMVVRLLRETDPARSRELVERLTLANSRDLPFLPCFEKRLMIFVQDGVRVSGWPAADDPMWSAAPLGVESLYCAMVVEGLLR